MIMIQEQDSQKNKIACVFDKTKISFPGHDIFEKYLLQLITRMLKIYCCLILRLQAFD